MYHGATDTIEPQVPVVDPGFPTGGMDLIGGHGLLRQLHFKNVGCQNERTWTLRGACAGHAP